MPEVSPPALTVWLADHRWREQAGALAAQLQLPLLEAEQLHRKQRANYPLLLCYGVDAVSLWQGNSEIKVDFVGGAARHRRLHGGGRGQPVARACGFKAGNIIPSILDATAGLGGDAFVLASLGAQVSLCERSPVVRALLADGLARAQRADDVAVAAIAARMHLLPQDSRHYLASLLKEADSPKPDVVFLDPMFPERRKPQAAVKKGMAAFHQLLGGDEDATELLPLALQVAAARVVVKRPQHAPTLDGLPAPLVQEGESVRFDLYPLKSMAQLR